MTHSLEPERGKVEGYTDSTSYTYTIQLSISNLIKEFENPAIAHLSRYPKGLEVSQRYVSEHIHGRGLNSLRLYITFCLIYAPRGYRRRILFSPKREDNSDTGSNKDKLEDIMLLDISQSQKKKYDVILSRKQKV